MKDFRVDIICPLYNAEKYIDNLNKSLLMQKNVNINKMEIELTGVDVGKNCENKDR